MTYRLALHLRCIRVQASGSYIRSILRPRGETAANNAIATFTDSPLDAESLSKPRQAQSYMQGFNQYETRGSPWLNVACHGVGNLRCFTFRKALSWTWRWPWWCNTKEIQSHARQSWDRIRVSGSVHVTGEVQSQSVTARNGGNT